MKSSENNKLDNLNPEIISKFKLSIELGHFPNGRKISQSQLELMLQALILYESEYVSTEKRTGFIEKVKNGNERGSYSLIEQDNLIARTNGDDNE